MRAGTATGTGTGTGTEQVRPGTGAGERLAASGSVGRARGCPQAPQHPLRRERSGGCGSGRRGEPGVPGPTLGRAGAQGAQGSRDSGNGAGWGLEFRQGSAQSEHRVINGWRFPSLLTELNLRRGSWQEWILWAD